MPDFLTCGPVLVPPGRAHWIDIAQSPDFPTFAGQPSKVLVIADTPGGSSRYLARLLWQTGGLGAAMEYFDLDHVSFTLSGLWGTSNWSAYIEELARRRTSPNGVLAMILSWVDVTCLSGLGVEITPTHFIQIQVDDLDGQAVAAAAALWDRNGNEDPPYEARYIQAAANQIGAYQKNWDSWSAAQNCARLMIPAEHLAEEPAAVVRTIRDWMEVEEAASIQPPTLSPVVARPSWLRRYRQEKGS